MDTQEIIALLERTDKAIEGNHPSMRGCPTVARAAIDKINELELRNARLYELSRCFYQDVMPQVGKLTINDYAGLNELGMLLNK